MTRLLQGTYGRCIDCVHRPKCHLMVTQKTTSYSGRVLLISKPAVSLVDQSKRSCSQARNPPFAICTKRVKCSQALNFKVKIMDVKSQTVILSH